MEFLNKIDKKNILVVGDTILDIYSFGDISRISPEAPVPIFRRKQKNYVLGGAGNVALHLVAGNQNVSIFTIVGDDFEGQLLKNMFQKKGVETNLVFISNRKSTVKERYLANNQQILRVDTEDTTDISFEECKIMLAQLEKVIHHYDLIVISDYLKGLLTYELTQGIIQLANQKRIKVIIDIKDTKIDKYKGAYLLKPNVFELQALMKTSVENNTSALLASQWLREKCDCTYVLTTCGAEGIIFASKTEHYLVKTEKTEIVDATGAGDTVIAYIALCIANQIHIKQAIKVANYAASLQVKKLGTSVVYLQELKNFVKKSTHGFHHKLLNHDEANRLREIYANKKMVFTNGCFDILHTGHVRYLQEASSLGDILVVALNSDQSVKRQKGSSRPIYNVQDRAELLCALECIDYVVIFHEDTPYNIIKSIQPDILVKGDDYSAEDVIGKDLVESRGGRLQLLKRCNGKSTTNIINKIKS